MKARVADKNKAIALRKIGYTYSEIISVIPNLSKSTLCGWLKNIILTENQKHRIISKTKNAAARSAIKGSWTNRRKALERIDKIQAKAEREFASLAVDHRFVLFVSLYWAEGSKSSRSFQFMNSDPKIIRLMVKCLESLFGLGKNDISIRIYAHKVYWKESYETYWLKLTGLPESSIRRTIFKSTPHSIKKDPKYHGCCRIELKGSELYWKTIKWQELLFDKFCPRSETDIT